VIVTKAYGRKSCKGIVSDNHAVFIMSVLLEVKLLFEANILVNWVFDESKIAVNVPKHAHEVTDSEYDDHELKSFEEV